MDKKIKSVEELAADEGFQDYVLGYSVKAERRWKRRLKKNPDFQYFVNEARILVLMFSPRENRIVQKNNRKLLRTVLKIASSVLLIAVASFLIAQELKKDIPEITKVAVDGNIDLHLSDLTEVKLRQGSSITYKPSWDNSNDRLVTLKGEAYFDVTKGKPFTVKLQNGSVKVLGTKFLVRTDSAHVQVMLEEGKVAFAAEGKTYTMIPGDHLIFSENTATIQSGNDINNYTSWSKNKLSFENEPLRNVINTINNSYDMEVELSRGKLAERRITTTIDQNDPLLLLEAIAAIYEIDIVHSKDKIILK